MLVFEERGKPEYLRKTSEQSRLTNKLNPHMTPGPGIEPRTHWREANALTTRQPCFTQVILRNDLEQVTVQSAP